MLQSVQVVLSKLISLGFCLVDSNFPIVFCVVNAVFKGLLLKSFVMNLFFPYISKLAHLVFDVLYWIL